MPLTNALQTHFGFSAFREGQEDAIRSLLAQQHTLAIMPTGAGKSLIYQLAALMLGADLTPAPITLVISPLIALMKDQVDALNRKGISATYINSAIPTSEQNTRLQNLKENKYRLVYVAPERLRSVPFLNALGKGGSESRPNIALFAVDEAHCISEWGHDFRPDYLHIAEARRQLGSPLTVALTATATPKVQSDIVRLLGLPASTKQIVTGFNRSNLTLEVKYTANTEVKFRALSELLRMPELNSGVHGATLIYTGTRRDAEEVAEFVRVVCKLKAEHYHAGLPADERARIQERFINGATPVIVATNAFGMGIDRADVRQVLHYTLPGSLEAYYQEAGRAGRDGLPAQVVLLYDPQDRALQEFFIQSSVVSPEELQLIYRALGNEDELWMTSDEFARRTDLHQVKIKVGLAELERVGALEHLGDDGLRMLLRKGKWDARAIESASARSREHTRHRTEQLDHIIHYAETNACRRRIVLKHFGDNASPDAPVCCDNCLSQKETPTQGNTDVTQMSLAERAALIILDTVRRLGTRQVGKTKLAQVLKGSKAQDIQKFHYDKSPYYAKLAALKQSEIEELITQLLALGYFKVIGGEYPVLSLTPKGETAIKNKAPITLKMPQGLSTHAIEKKKAQLAAGGTLEYTEKLLNDGLTPEQIARQRGLTMMTIYGHCAKLIEAGKLDVNKVVAKDVQEKIKRAIEKVVSTQYLSPIKSRLPDEITFEMIRCVVAADANVIRNTKSVTPDEPLPTSDSISAYLSVPHPRPLKGNWHSGFALDFHSAYRGADWNRSGIGDLTFKLKYQADASVLPALVDHTRKLFNTHPEMNQFDIILPVPSSAQRDFSPVHEFCKALSRAFNKPMLLSVIKTRQTQPQKEMQTLVQKRDNVAGAFALNGDLAGKRVLLVDDLFDSGATLEEITRVLLKHKTAQVNVLTLTRTIHADA